MRALRGELPTRVADSPHPVPFVPKLRAIVKGDRLALPEPEEFVAAVAPPIGSAKPPAWVSGLLASGRALVLVDGIDEVRDLGFAIARIEPMNRRQVTSDLACCSSDAMSDGRFGAVLAGPAIGLAAAAQPDGAVDGALVPEVGYRGDPPRLLHDLVEQTGIMSASGKGNLAACLAVVRTVSRGLAPAPSWWTC